MENPSKTLIMIDNSLSIKNVDREKIADFIEEYAYDKPMDELVAISTFSENISFLTDFVADKNEIKNAMEILEYSNQETYLTDVLYEVLANSAMGDEDCYKKIIVISDGVDNKAIGYTKEELYDLIKKKNIPIYTIGCVNKNNNEQLENMFALSRYTNGLNWILDDVEKITEIASEILEDSHVVHAIISPDAELMDGSSKNVIINIGSASLECDLKMPSKAMEKGLEQPSEPESIITESSELDIPVVESGKTNTLGTSVTVIILIGGILALLLISLIIAIVIRGRKKKEESEKFVSLGEKIDLIVPQNNCEKTEFVGVNHSENGETQMLWNEQARVFNLSLTDVNSPGRTFQVPIRGEVIIGRNSQQANLVVDYDKSVSGKHCEILERQGKFYIKDLKSSNGTYLNGARILTEMEIHSGCMVRLGRITFKVEIK